MLKQLKSSSGHLIDLDSATAPVGGQDKATLNRRAIVVHVGSFSSKDGPVDFSAERIQAFIKKNNELIATMESEYGGREKTPVGAYPPILEDHEQQNQTEKTIGRNLGPYTYAELDIPKVGSKVPCAISECVRFIGEKNVQRALDGRVYHFSVGIDDADGDRLDELTVTPFPAAAGAMLLSRGKRMAKASFYGKHKGVEFSIMKDGNQFYVRVGNENYGVMYKTEFDAIAVAKKIIDRTQLSKGGSMSKKRLAKLTSGISALKRLAGEAGAIRTKLVADAATFRLAARRNAVRGELTGLVRMGKMTPAELKATKIEEIATLDEKAYRVCMSGYKNRQPVIKVGQVGTTDGMEAGAMAQEIGAKRLKAETKKELKRLGAKLSEDSSEKKENPFEKKLASEETEKKELSGEPDADTEKKLAEYGEHLKHCKAALEAGDSEKAKEHLAKMEEAGPKLKHLSIGYGDQGADDSQKKMAEMEEHLAKLSSVVDRMGGELSKLAGGEEEEEGKELSEDDSEEEAGKKLADEDGEEKKKLSTEEAEKKLAEGDEKDKEEEADKAAAAKKE